MPKKETTRTNRILREIAMCYLLLVIPAVFVYGGMRLFTDLRGKALFNSYLPAILIIAIIYLYYLLRPLRWFGAQEHETSKREASQTKKAGQFKSDRSDSNIQNTD